MNRPEIVTDDDLTALMREAVREAGSSTALAERWGVSKSLVSLCLNGKVPPGVALAKRLGYQRVYRYVGRRGVCHGE